MKRCDLHTHSTFSDGSLTPTELVSLAEKQDIAALALTDHNTSKGLAEFMQAGQHSCVLTVPGCEFTTAYEGREVHMVGLFFPQDAWVEIEDFVELMHIAKQSSNYKLIAALQKDGYAITFEEVASTTEADAFNRAHVARVLVEKGYVRSVKHAFETLLKEGNGYYTPAKKLNTLATIKFIKSFGGKAVLAHPFLNFSPELLEEFLPHARNTGLDAIETHYTEFDEAQTALATTLARRFDLLESGGSDFHGDAKPDIHLGSGYGRLCVPFSFYEALKEK